jgi:hypothetical protein
MAKPMIYDVESNGFVSPINRIVVAVERGRLVEMPDGMFWWKTCDTQFCTNGICLGYSYHHCYVHMPKKARDRKDADGRG